MRAPITIASNCPRSFGIADHLCGDRTATLTCPEPKYLTTATIVARVWRAQGTGLSRHEAPGDPCRTIAVPCVVP